MRRAFLGLARRVPALALAVSCAAGAQDDPAPSDTLSAVEAAAAPALEALGEEGVGDPETLAADLADLRENPVDINSATIDDLAAVPGLSRIAAGAIVAHRTRAGPFETVEGLLRVTHVTPAALAVARPFIAARTGAAGDRGHSTRRQLRGSITSRMSRRLETAAGYREPDTARVYRGSPFRFLTRLRADAGRSLVTSLTLEKDPGEAFGDNRLGYDHVSGTAALHRQGPVRTLVAGDYTAAFGQGLALGRGGGMGKSADATRSPVRAGRGVRPFTSGGETSYLRGLAVTVAPLPYLEVTGFASRRRLDATMESPAGPARTPGGDGLHRTAAELARRGALRESIAGGAAEFRRAGARLDGRIGVAGYVARYHVPVIPPARPDTRFAPAGAGASVATAFADARLGMVHGFAEAARAAGSTAALAGVGVAPARGTEVLALARYYPPGFASPYGSAFGERAGTGQNEQGVYLGARTSTGAWSVAAYVDAYRFPWLRFNVPRPSAGREALVRVDYAPRRWLRLYAQLKVESRDQGSRAAAAGGSTVGALTRDARRVSRIHAEFDASRSLRLRVRFEAAVTSDPLVSHRGFLTFQDVRWTLSRRVRLDARVILFEADDFSARVYQLESDLAGVFALPALHGRGARAYALLTVTPRTGLVIQAKLAGTFLEDTLRQGSGPDRIEGHRASDAGIQVRWRF